MFQKFNNRNMRIAYGGTAFIEFQYCKLKSGTKLSKITALSSIRHWQDDSLYVHVGDMEHFISDYKDIFDGVDCTGINYYSPEQLKEIVKKLAEQKPFDYAVLLDWLQHGSDYNGVYIFGI